MNFNASGPASNNNSIAGGAMHQGQSLLRNLDYPW